MIENMKMAIASLRANKMRSFLTMLGIIIGIGSVIAITSIGDTMRKMFSDVYKDIGVTQSYLYLGYWIEDTRDSDFFTMDDFEIYKDVFGDKLQYIDASNMVSADVQTDITKKKFDIYGVDYNYIDVQPVDIAYGRYLNESDIKGRKPNCVMEAAAAYEIFGTENAVGKTIRVPVYGNITDLNIIGIYKKEVSPFQKMMMGNTGRGEAYIPWTLMNSPGDLIYNCRYFADVNMNEAELKQFNEEFKAYVEKQKGRNPGDFFLNSAQEQMGQVDTMLGGVSAAVGGIAAISLLVGGIGIMNIMLVSVTERTREIGIRKALGARTKDIMIQFLTESAVLSAIGGSIGILLASGLLYIAGKIFSLPIVVKPQIVFIAVGFSALVGLFFGIFPAKKAAEKDPIVALRYE